MSVWLVRSISTNRLVAVAAGETLASLGRALTGHWSAQDCEATHLPSMVLFSGSEGGAVVPITPNAPGGHIGFGRLDVLGANPLGCLIFQSAIWGPEQDLDWVPVDPEGLSPATRLARILARPDGDAIVEQMMAQTRADNGPDICDLLASFPENDLPPVAPARPFPGGL